MIEPEYCFGCKCLVADCICEFAGLGEDDAAPYDDPMPPFRVDDEGDIVDANGWLIACPARGIWKNRQTLAETLCAVLNGDQ